MRWDLIICGLLFPLIPLINTFLIRWRLKQLQKSLTGMQTLALLMGLCIVGITIANILWILLGISSGVLQAIFTATTFNEGLRLGFDRAVPLDPNEDLIAWGLLPPVICDLCLNVLAHAFLIRVLKRKLNEG